MIYFVAGGCSNTAGVGFDDYTEPSYNISEKQSIQTWPNIIASMSRNDITVYNTAQGGSSNNKIARLVIQQILDLKNLSVDVRNIKVGVMWTSPVRYELMTRTGKSHNIGLWDTQIGHQSLNSACDEFIGEILSVTEMYAYESLKQIHYLQEFLKNECIDYFYTVSDNNTLNIPTNTDELKLHFTDVSTATVFKQLIDWDKFVYANLEYMSTNSGMVDIGTLRGYPRFACKHFGADTHNEFVRDHLYPELKQRNFI